MKVLSYRKSIVVTTQCNMRIDCMIDILCIGNPDLIGDSVGPLVGTQLVQRRCSANIIGTVDDPIVSSNYASQLKRLRRGATIIVVDSVVGHEVGEIKIVKGSMRPGESVVTYGRSSKKTRRLLESIGDYSIKAVTADSVYKLFSVTEDTAAALATQITTLLLDSVENYDKNKGIYKT